MAEPTRTSAERELATSGRARWHGGVEGLALNLGDEDGLLLGSRRKLAVSIIEERRNRFHKRGSDGTTMEFPAALRKVAMELEEADIKFGVGGSGAVDIFSSFFFLFPRDLNRVGKA